MKIGGKHSEETKKKIGDKSRGKTISESQKLAISKAAQGEGSSFSKLITKDVLEIRRLVLEGYRDTTIAEKFNVDKRSIYNIRTNRTWSRVHLLPENTEDV